MCSPKIKGIVSKAIATGFQVLPVCFESIPLSVAPLKPTENFTDFVWNVANDFPPQKTGMKLARKLLLTFKIVQCCRLLLSLLCAFCMRLPAFQRHSCLDHWLIVADCEQKQTAAHCNANKPTKCFSPIFTWPRKQQLFLEGWGGGGGWGVVFTFVIARIKTAISPPPTPLLPYQACFEYIP